MQSTKIRAFKSSYKRKSCGVSHICVLVPLLFLISLMISLKLPLFMLLYLLMILTFTCSTLVLMFFRQLSTFNYVKLTTGLEPTNFLLITIGLTLCC